MYTVQASAVVVEPLGVLKTRQDAQSENVTSPRKPEVHNTSHGRNFSSPFAYFWFRATDYTG